jgi:hypothetical protein
MGRRSRVSWLEALSFQRQKLKQVPFGNDKQEQQLQLQVQVLMLRSLHCVFAKGAKTSVEMTRFRVRRRNTRSSASDDSKKASVSESADALFYDECVDVDVQGAAEVAEPFAPFT